MPHLANSQPYLGEKLIVIVDVGVGVDIHCANSSKVVSSFLKSLQCAIISGINSFLTSCSFSCFSFLSLSNHHSNTFIRYLLWETHGSIHPLSYKTCSIPFSLPSHPSCSFVLFLLFQFLTFLPFL